MGPPLSLAQSQVDSVTAKPGENIVKVVVYFTDGLMNTIQDNFACPSTVLLNYGGHDSGSQVDIFDPNTGTDWGHYTSGTGFPYDAKGDICKNSSGQIVTKFLEEKTGTQTTLGQTAVTADAQYRAIQTAIAMRTESPTSTFIFTIGLGQRSDHDDPGVPGATCQSPSYSTYVSKDSQPACSSIYLIVRRRRAQLRFRKRFKRLLQRSCCASLSNGDSLSLQVFHSSAVLCEEPLFRVGVVRRKGESLPCQSGL